MDRLVCEHESAFAILQRDNERLQVELDMLKSQSNFPVAARGESGSVAPATSDRVNVCSTPRRAKGETLVESQGITEEVFSTFQPRSTSHSSREQRLQTATPIVGDVVLDEAESLHDQISQASHDSTTEAPSAASLRVQMRVSRQDVMKSTASTAMPPTLPAASGQSQLGSAPVNAAPGPTSTSSSMSLSL